MTKRTTSPATSRMTSRTLLARFWQEFVTPYYGEMLRLVPVFILAASASAVYGFIMKFSVDAITARDVGAIKLIPVAVIVAAVLRASAIWSQSLMTRDLSLKTLKDMQRAMFAKLMRVDYATFSAIRQAIWFRVSPTTSQRSATRWCALCRSASAMR